jgi:hypothetical protein
MLDMMGGLGGGVPPMRRTGATGTAGLGEDRAQGGIGSVPEAQKEECGGSVRTSHLRSSLVEEQNGPLAVGVPRALAPEIDFIR